MALPAEDGRDSIPSEQVWWLVIMALSKVWASSAAKLERTPLVLLTVWRELDKKSMFDNASSLQSSSAWIAGCGKAELV
ncbi:hypothetical protein Pyn_37386 [Prunus yedoensis var. nudiflora]|uniref:Uncharacterized protein n=1 Tax=Prunus yedoensis var. nudiflora TaxID=2094558 RepID=A0A314YWJ2_PRUYE|nr:hypothetical protein Pyn_37386 [Prunus yedoensis var. nudiflora]